jgi:hypothetical protein
MDLPIPKCLAVLSALVMALLGAAPALAAPPWLPPTVIGQSFLVSNAQIAVDASGEAVALWEHVTLRGPAIESASRPPGGAWSAPVTLTKPGTSKGIPGIAANASGEAVAVWEHSTRRGVVIESASRPAGGTWSAPSVLSLRVQNSFRPRIAIDGAGEAIVLWERPADKNSIIESASRPPGGVWSAPTVLSEKEKAAGVSPANQEPQIAVNASGEAVAAWKQTDGGDSFVIESASRPAGGVWSTPTVLSPEGRIGSSVVISRVLIAAAGEAVAVWQRFDRDVSIESASRPPGGAWSAPTVITETRYGSLTVHRGSLTVPRVAMNAGGEVIAVWRHIHPRGRNDPGIQSASRPPGGAWSAPTAITAKRGINAPRVAIDGAGEAIAVWEGFTGKASVIESASRPPGR